MFQGERLKELRTEKKLSQKELARIFNTTQVSISGYENNTREPDNELITKIAKYFNTTTDYLLGSTDNPVILPDIKDDFLFYDKTDLTQDDEKYLTELVEIIKKRNKVAKKLTENSKSGDEENK